MSERLSQLRPAAGSVHERKRIGRGIGSGHGKTSGRGHKGQKSRAGGAVRPGFEGGQTPLARRIPRLRGFKPRNRVEYAVVNVAALSIFEDNAQVTPEALLERRLITDLKNGVKILGDGEIGRPLVVHAHKFSASAGEKIRAAGGSVEVIPARE